MAQPQPQQQQPTPLTAVAANCLFTARTSAIAFLDTTDPREWVDALHEIEKAVENLHPTHTVAYQRRLQVRHLPLCYASPASRDTAFARARLSNAERAEQSENSALLSSWNFNWRRGSGVVGLVCSPTDNVTFERSTTSSNAFRQEAQQQNLQPGSQQYANLYEAHRLRWYNEGGYWQHWHAVAVYVVGRRVRYLCVPFFFFPFLFFFH